MGYGLLHLGVFHQVGSLIEFKLQVSKPLNTASPAVKSCAATHHLVCKALTADPLREKQTSTSWRPAPCFPGLSDSGAHLPFHSAGPLICLSPMMSSNSTSYWTTKLAMIPELEKADWSCSGWTEGNFDTGLSLLTWWMGVFGLTCMGGGMKSSPGRKPSKGTSKGAISGDEM